MQYGLVMFPTDQAIGPVELAVAAEEHGFESLWFPEHSHIPASRRTPAGGRAGAAPLPPYYWRTHDALVAFGAIAAATSRLKLGTGITLVAQRDPIWLAKQVATLDTLSEGRVLFGVGYGWNVEEMENHGTKYPTRRELLREKVLAMQQIWKEEEPEFHGRYVDFDPIWQWPKPIQRPGPPIILGSGPGPKSFAHVTEFCDGWIPIGGRWPLEKSLIELRAACEQAGRDPDEIEISIFHARPGHDHLDQLEELGVGRAIFSVPPEGPEEVMPLLDEYERLVSARD